MNSLVYLFLNGAIFLGKHFHILCRDSSVRLKDFDVIQPQLTFSDDKLHLEINLFVDIIRKYSVI